MRVIPAIDIRRGKCVRLQQGDFERETVYDSSPLEMGRTWDQAGAELIHIVDLDGAKAGSPRNLDSIAEVCRTVSCQCELGGGIRSTADIEAAHNAGVARVILGSVLVDDPELAATLLKDFDTDELVAGIDARNGRVAIHGWQEDSTLDAVSLATQLFDQGLRTVIYTDISRDGMFTGSNLEAMAVMCDAVPKAAVIASGGIGCADDVRRLVALQRSNLTGVIVGKALYDGRVTYAELKAAAEE